MQKRHSNVEHFGFSISKNPSSFTLKLLYISI